MNIELQFCSWRSYVLLIVAEGGKWFSAGPGYVFASPFFLLLAKVFFPLFFLKVQVVRTDDLHLLQFLTSPALN